MQWALPVATQGIEHKFAHLDTSTISLHGKYETYYDLQEDIPDADHSANPEVVRITKGYSKDNAPDLNQVVVTLITSYKFIKEAQYLLETTSIDSMTELENGYRIKSVNANYAAVAQR